MTHRDQLNWAVSPNHRRYLQVQNSATSRKSSVCSWSQIYALVIKWSLESEIQLWIQPSFLSWPIPYSIQLEWRVHYIRNLHHLSSSWLRAFLTFWTPLASSLGAPCFKRTDKFTNFEKKNTACSVLTSLSCFRGLPTNCIFCTSVLCSYRKKLL